MANSIKLNHNNSSGYSPSSTLAAGEVAVNTANQKIWVGNGTGNTLVFSHASYAPASANASQSWVSSNFSNNAGDITAVSAGGGITGGGTSGGVTISHADTSSASNIDTSGASVVNQLNVDTYGHVTTLNTRTLTLANLGYTGATNANYINNTNQLVNGAGYATSASVTSAINAVIDAAPGALNTLNELAASIGDDASYATTVTNALAGKSSTSHTHSVTAGQFSQQNFTTTLKNKLDGIAASANNYSFPYSITAASTAGTVAYRDSSGDLTARLFRSEYDTVATASSIGYINVQYNTAADNYIRPATAASVRTFLNVADGATNTAAPFYTSPIAVTDGGLTQRNFTTTLKNKLDGIAATANNYSFPYTVSASAGNSTVVQRHSSGYIFANYFHTSPNTITTNVITKIVAESGDDGYMRHADAGSVRSFLNVANGATNVTNNNQLTNGAGYITSYVNTTYSEGDHGLTQANFTDTLRTKLNGIAATANNYSFPYTISTGQSANTVVRRDGSGYLFSIYFNGTGTFSTSGASSGMGNFTGTNGSDTYGRSYNATAARALLNVADGATNTAAPHYTSAIAVGAGGLTQQNFTTTLKSKLDGIATGATNTAAPYYTSAIASTSLTNWAASSAGTIHSSNYTNTTYSVGAGGLTQQNFTTTLKNKLDGIAAGATNTATPYYTSAIAEGDHGRTQANFTDTLRTKLNGIATGATNTAAPFYTSPIAVGAGGLTQQNFTTTLKNKLDGIAASATNTAAPHYTSAIAVGDGGLTQKNFTTTLKSKLDGIAAGAQANVGVQFNGVYSAASGGLNFGGGYVSHYIGSGWNHIPSGGSAGQFVGWNGNGDATWVANPNTTYSAGAGIHLSGTTFSLTTAAFTDATSAVDTVSDEVMMFDAGVPSRKRFTEIFGSNAYNSTAFITSSQPTMSMLFGGASSGVTNQGFSRDSAYKIMNNSNSSVACVTTVNGSSNEYLRYASGGNFSWDTIEYNQLQNVSALTALP